MSVLKQCVRFSLGCHPVRRNRSSVARWRVKSREAQRSLPVTSEDIVRIGVGAGLQRKAAAPYAVGESVPQSGEVFDSFVEIVAPFARYTGPVLLGRYSLLGELVQGFLDPVEADADSL